MTLSMAIDEVVTSPSDLLLRHAAADGPVIVTRIDEVRTSEADALRIRLSAADAPVVKLNAVEAI